MKKKILLGIGAIAAVTIPVVAVVACSDNQTPTEKLSEKGKVVTKEWAEQNSFTTDGKIETLKGDNGAYIEYQKWTNNNSAIVYVVTKNVEAQKNNSDEAFQTLMTIHMIHHFSSHW